MGKKLAIKGHSTRGKEVIELLEMMGGKNFTLDGTNDWYVINDLDNSITFRDHNYINCHEFVKFTLEEFLEKYPFKVGDKVLSCYGYALTIKSMAWSEDYETMVYDFEDSAIVLTAEDLLKYDNRVHKRTHEDVIFDSTIWHLRNSVNNGKQNLSGGECEDYFREVVKKNNENKMKSVLAELLEHIKTTPKEELEREFEEIEEWSNVGPTIEEFMTFCGCVNMKPKYPTTYVECCEKINACPIVSVSYDSDEDMLYNDEVDLTLLTLRKLLICCKAYWKIAGEEMGLGKPWEPDWSNGDETKFCIYTTQNIISLNIFGVDNRILAFPTEEMRDAFYENFKDLIEQCKELL